MFPKIKNRCKTRKQAFETLETKADFGNKTAFFVFFDKNKVEIYFFM